MKNLNHRILPRNSTTYSHIGAILKEKRAEAGLTQKQMGELAGVSLKAIREIEQGREENVNVGALKRILAYFALTIHVAEDTSIGSHSDAAISREDLMERLRSISVAIKQKYDIQRVRLFGSYSRGEARPDSDVDILLTPGRVLSFKEIVQLEKIFQNVVGKKEIDLVLESEMDPGIKAAAEKDMIDVKK